MSSLGTILAPASSVAAHGSQPVSARADAGASQNAAATSTTVGTAAVVTLSASSKDRAPSTGDKRQVDAAFDKQQPKGGAEKKNSATNTTPSIDIAA